MSFEGASLLITGGAGFIGSNLTRRLLSDGAAKIDVVDNFLSSVRFNVPIDDRVSVLEGSIADDDILDQLSDDYDYIFHLATYHGNQSSIANPLADHQNNLLTTLKLLERVKDFGRLSKLVYSGAGCAVAEKTFEHAYATPEDAPISVEMDSPYSISKIAGEFYCVYYHNQLGVPTIRARFQNVYGPREILGAGQWRGTPATVWRNVIPTFIYKALSGQSLPIEGDGTTSRDFIYVADVVQGLQACALRGAPGNVYNLASGVETTIGDLASLINEITGNKAPIEWRPRRSWDRSGRRFGSTRKSHSELGFDAQTTLREGLERTVEWTRANIGVIQACISRHETRYRV